MSVEWTDPRTWVVGEKVRAAHLNANLRDNLLFLFRTPRVSVRRSEDLTVPDQDHVMVEWDEPLEQVGDWYDPGSPETLVVPRDGTYLAGPNILWESSSDGDRQIRLLRDIGNGWEPFRGLYLPAAFTPELSTCWITSLLAGWSVGLDVRQTSGGPLDVVASSPPTRSPVLSLIWAGPAVD